LTYVFTPLAERDRLVLERFVRKVDELRGSRFAGTQTALRATFLPGVTAVGGPAWNIAATGPDDEAVKAVVGDFRQLYTDHNPTSGTSVIKILSRSASRRGTDAGARMCSALRELRREMARRRLEDPRGKLLEEQLDGSTAERSPDEIIKTWMNGEYLHDDLEKASEIPLGHGATEMMRISLQMAMRDFLSYWVRIRAIAAAVLNEPALRG